ncbi:hypothetical protein RI129_009413 [Pyrocoelia pectoralis]|uniref:Uncharacterized protein n=1 Tax=Pyrocoelia pectoralis TaxID=417401 RepID=A0AAN7ZHU9_9COLE
MHILLLLCVISITSSAENIPFGYASSIAVYKKSAYLAFPRSSCYSNLFNPTLLEVQWNGENSHLNLERKSFFSQSWGKCDQLQSVISVDVENRKGRLWVLDDGNSKCSPKVIVYNLFTNKELAKWTLTGVGYDELSTLTLDISSEYGTLCYLGQKRLNKLTIFSFNQRKWYEVSIVGGVVPERVAISATDSKLYITKDRDDDVFAINLTEIREIGKGSKMVDQSVSSFYVGKKLGPSSGFVTDIAGGLNYCLTRDYAVLRWVTTKPLLAENHEVLLQSLERLPNVAELFNDAQSNLWALVNPLPNEDCHSEKERKNFSSLHLRFETGLSVVRLSKFVRLGLRKKLFVAGYY